MIHNTVRWIRSFHQCFKIRFIKISSFFRLFRSLWFLHLLKFPHHCKLISRVIHIIEFVSIWKCIRWNTRKPWIFIRFISCHFVIQRCNLFHISIVHFFSSWMTEHEIHMIHRSVDFNTVTRHTLYIDICVAWINIIPCSIHLYRIPKVNLTKIACFAKHWSIRIESYTNHINNVILGNINISFFIIIQIICCLPVCSHTHVRSSAIDTIDFRTHVL